MELRNVSTAPEVSEIFTRTAVCLAAVRIWCALLSPPLIHVSSP